MAAVVTSDPDPVRLAGKLLADFASFAVGGDLVAIPTGRSPEILYKRIREDGDMARLWSQLKYLQLDEYLDAPAGVPLFSEELRQKIFDPIEVPPENRLSIDPSRDPGAEALRLDRLCQREGPLKVVVLGLGGYGHIAFNEPAESFGSGYRLVHLARETIRANFSKPYPEEVRALTIGVDQIISAAHIQLLVPQAQKQELLERVLAGPIDPQLPASALFEHPSLHIYRMEAP